jgi:hypothetical protein
MQPQKLVVRGDEEKMPAAAGWLLVSRRAVE